MWQPSSRPCWIAGVRLGPALDALLRQPVVLDELRLAGLVDPLVGVDAEALHRAVAGGDAARAEHERDHVHRLGRLRDEVEDAVGDLALEGDRVRLLRVDEVGELDRVADEEDAEVVADEVPVAVLGVELHREAARVADRLGGVAAAGHGREAHGDARSACRPPGRASRGCTSRSARRRHLPVGLEVAERRSSRARARPAPGSARGRSGSSSRGSGSSRASRDHGRRSCAGSGCRRPGGPGGW